MKIPSVAALLAAMASTGCGGATPASEAGPAPMPSDDATARPDVAVADAGAAMDIATTAIPDALGPEATTGRSGDAAAEAAIGDSPSEATPSSGDGGPEAGQTAAWDGGIQGASTFRCGNWADPRDNFVNGNLEPSGLSATTDTLPTVTAKADSLLAAFQATTGANAVRIPVNEPTVLGAWWSAYKGVIDAAVARGMRVLVAYWAWHTGKPDNVVQFFTMWDAIVATYAGNGLVYFQIHNEPYGYTGPSFITLAVQWLARYPSVPPGRVIVAGTAYDGDVTLQGADARLNGTLLSLHIYPFSSPSQTSTQAWRTSIQNKLGAYAARTIVSEWGAPMAQGTDYGGPGDGNNNTSFMTGISGYLHDNVIGSCYWPILRNGDPWSLTTLNGTGTSLSVTVTNLSGVARVKSAFGL